MTRKISGSGGFMRLSYLMQAVHILCNSAPDRTILADIPKPQRKNDAATPLERAQEYLYQHYTEGLSLDGVAAAAGMEKTALCRAFKKTTGHTIIQCVIRMRIEQACHLLLTTSLTISQVAWQCGFGSFSQFSTQFRRQVGMSPGEYRSVHWGKC
ncbi:MAG: AraC family transcriptional regulator [Bacteroidales bacterium]|nr:AraC family transcriptional regulator [Bacteroidales bacterium]